MYNFKQKFPRKRYGKVKQGWHTAKIYQVEIKNVISKNSRQYIKVDFEIISDSKYADIIVPGFFSCKKNRRLDRRFLRMGSAAGLNKEYGPGLQPIFSDLLGKELLVYVVHKYLKGRLRRDRIDDFNPLPEPGFLG